MSNTNQNNITPPGNGQPSPEARQFIVAFIPTSQTNITHVWSLKASGAIQALIDFRSSVHRWQAAGQVNDLDFVTEIQRLEDAGLAGYVDELMASALREIMR